MTKRMMVGQIFKLCGGRLNHSEMTQKDFLSDLNSQIKQNYGEAWFSITLPDGDWLMQIKHYEWGWDYYIPDNEEQEKVLEEIYKSRRCAV